MEVTFYGHASIGIKIGETHLLIDPFISENPLASDIDINQIKADLISRLLDTFSTLVLRTATLWT